MPIRFEVCPSLSSLFIGCVEANQVYVGPADERLIDYCDQVVARTKPHLESSQWSAQCQEIRQLLRFGKFKAAGRSKPAQEYLIRCIINDGSLPRINAPVDLLNAVSVEFNLPISLLSVEKCSETFFIGRGQAGQSYVFNSAGQQLDLSDLVTIYDNSFLPPRPVGTPIKDSMAGKIEAEDQHLVAFIYAPNSNAGRSRCEQAKDRLTNGFVEFCQTR